MTIRIGQITATDWSPKVGSPGEIVTGLADIEQCLDIIITTRKGSVPHRPLFGCDAWLHLDKPFQLARPLIIREAVDALEMWEPRIDVLSVTAAIPSVGEMTVTIAWRPKNTTLTRYKEVSLANAA